MLADLGEHDVAGMSGMRSSQPSLSTVDDTVVDVDESASSPDVHDRTVKNAIQPTYVASLMRRPSAIERRRARQTCDVDPRLGEAGKAGLAGEELLHHALLDRLLLGDQPLERRDQVDRRRARASAIALLLLRSAGSGSTSSCLTCSMFDAVG